MKYMPFIDGLRAIAVSIVFIFHLNPAWLSGGFIGVDVFFVISGFLITGILVKNVGKERFYGNFILARCRRLVPAYLMVLLVVSIVSYFLLLPNEMLVYANSLVSSLFFLSNFLFYFNSGYFDGASEYFPLLHTWSLAVEWQYYVVYPFLIMFISRYFSSKLFWFLFVAFVVSTIVTWQATNIDASLAFYITPFRAFELLLGGLVSTLVIAPSKLVQRLYASTYVIGVLVCIAVVGIFYFSVVLSKESVFPGLNALWVALLTAFILSAGVMQKGAAWQKPLELRAVVFVGKISYSLYLWHWPVILFSKFYFGELHLPQHYAFVVVCSVVLAVFSWSLVENNFRLQNAENNKTIYKSSLAVLALALVFYGFVKSSNGFENRLNPEQLSVLNVKRWADFPGMCSHTQSQDKFYDCLFGDASKTPGIFLWGDSHGQVMVWQLDEWANGSGQSLHSITKGGCPPIINGVPTVTNIEKDICLVAQQQAINKIRQSPEIQTVVLAARWRGYAQKQLSELSSTNQLVIADEAFAKKFSATVDELLRLDKRVIIVDSIPEPGFRVPEVLSRNALLGHKRLLSFTDEPHSVQKLISEQAKTNDKLQFIEPYHTLCEVDNCKLMNEQNKVLYFDSNHLTDAGVSLIIKKSLIFH
jgi:peptidoglycan/LPS O-acetylase OafA/YrhL